MGRFGKPDEARLHEESGQVTQVLRSNLLLKDIGFGLNRLRRWSNEAPVSAAAHVCA
jgi:hypothetical protein